MSVVIPAGYRTEIYYLEETTEGSAPSGGTPPPTYLSFYGMVDERISRTLLTQPTVASRDFSFIDMGIKQYELSITTFPTNNSLLSYAVENAENKTLTFWLKHPQLTQNHVYSGAKITTLRLTGGPGTHTQAVLTVWPAKFSTTAPTANTSPLPTALPYHGRDAYVKLNTATMPEFRAFSVDINNNAEYVPQLSSDEYRVVRVRNRVVTGEITATFESTARLTELLNNTEFTLEIGLGKDDGSTVRKLTITGCKWREHPIPSRKTDLILLRLPFQGETPTLS